MNSMKRNDCHAESKKFRYRNKWVAYGMLFPAVCLITIFVIVPLVMAIKRSFYDYNTDQFVGFYNFLYVLRTPSFIKAFTNVLMMAAFVVVITMVSSFLFAVLLNSLRNRICYIAKVCVFIPFFISGIVAAIIFSLLTNFGGGLFNSILLSMGKDPIAFAVDGIWPYATIIAVTVWLGFGYQTLIMYAGLLQIPKHYYEAAKLDGANAWHQMISITIPNMKNYFVLILINLVTANLQMFEVPFMVTGGGPVEKTTTPVMYLFNSFRDPSRPPNVTIAGALIVMMLIMTINVIVFKAVRSEKTADV